MEKSPIQADECVVVEDSHWGLEAAAAAGMHRVAVTNTYRREQLDGKAELVVEGLGEISMADLKKICG